jgi:hypothetical protein
MNSMYGGKGAAGGRSRGNAAGDIIPEGYSKGQLQTFTPEQMELHKQSFAQVSPDSYTSRLAGGDQSLFQEMEAPAMRQFQEMQGENASRFSGFGMGARKGSGFQNYQNQATSDFAMNLQSKRQELRRQAIQDLMGMSHELLGQRPYERSLVEDKEEKSNLSGWAGLAGAGIGAAGGFFASGGNPIIAMKGAALGHSIGSSFK